MTNRINPNPNYYSLKAKKDNMRLKKEWHY